MKKPHEQEWRSDADGFHVVTDDGREILRATMGTEDAEWLLAKAAPKMARALRDALLASGCDGDLCMHQWHEDARAALREAGVLE